MMAIFSEIMGWTRKFFSFRFSSIFLWLFLFIFCSSSSPSSAKRLRLPMLLRSKDYGCVMSTKNETCVFLLNGFLFRKNSAEFLAGKPNSYQFEVNDPDDSSSSSSATPRTNSPPGPSTARFNMYYFNGMGAMKQSPETNLETNVEANLVEYKRRGCLQIDYLVQGNDVFLFRILQQSEKSSPHVVFSQHVGGDGQQSDQHRWNTANVDISKDMMVEDSSGKPSPDWPGKQWMFILEVVCRSCTKGSTFSISTLRLEWTKCPSR